ncbi:MAG: sensor histidine kinase [Candidatus Poribacteria bacterium]
MDIKQATILTIDDSPNNIRLLSTFLSRVGYNVLGAEDGLAGFGLAVTHQPDLILLDVMMPDMSGYEVIKMLKSEQKTQDIPVIFLTVKDEIEDKVHGLGLGAVDYITKPFNPAEVSARVATQLRLKSLHEKELLYQKALVESQRLVSIGRLGAGIGHNFNNLLTGVRGNLELVQMEVDPDSRIYQRVSTAIEAADRMIELIKKFLTFAGTGKKGSSQIELNGFIEEVTQFFVATIPKTLALKVEKADAPLYTIADVNLLQQAVFNLLNNAREAIQNEGNILIRINQVKLPELLYGKLNNKPADNYARIEVIDDGPGMTTDVLQHAVEPFFTTKQTVGAGLGLSVAYGIINNHSGVLDILSNVGEGTTVYVYLPII